MKKTLKVLGTLLAFAIVLFMLVANFSEMETRYECSGEISADDDTQPATLFLKFDRYRWWVGLWSDSDGSAWLEIPQQISEYVPHIEEGGTVIRFLDFEKKFKGQFSTLSNSVGVQVSAHGVFTGDCKLLTQ